MRAIVIMILNMCLVFSFASAVFGATVLSPKVDEQVEAGSMISVIVRPDSGEQWQTFIIGFDKILSYDPLNKVYKTTIQVPKDELGYRDDLVVTGVDNSGRTTNFKRRVFVKLPSNVVLAGIEVDDYEVLYKVPLGSIVQNQQDIETMKLNVSGIYSDALKRKLMSATTGTTYFSSDEKVVTVDNEGKITAQGLGKAKITVRNGKFTALVDVVVKPYK